MRQLKIYVILALFSFIHISCLVKNEASVVGKWDFLITNGYNCYACPKIEFRNNGTGNLIVSSSNKIEFAYTILPEKKIRFDFSKDRKQSLFKLSDTFYYDIHTDKDFEYFDLSDISNKELIHTLVKSRK